MNHDPIIRWTIGNVSDNGFEALRLSVWGAYRLFGPDAEYVVCVNSVPLPQARARSGPLPGAVQWRDVTSALWPSIRSYFDDDMAEGVGWKFAPLRLDDERHELALDNDCILWTLPHGLRQWLHSTDRGLLAEDVAPAFGQFADVCGAEPRNSGIRGLPPGVDIGATIERLLDERASPLTSELDEQGLQVAAVQQAAPPFVVRTDEVSICSPFPPHQPHLGSCGAHFVGLNARSLPWSLDGRKAVDHLRQHWSTHREELYDRVGITPAA